MSGGGFGIRRNELEEAFFADRDRELLEALRTEAAARQRREALAEAVGTHAEELLDELDQLGICAETLAAVSLVPLIAVAWADGSIDAAERQAVLSAAEQEGIQADHAAHRVLKHWLEKKPEHRLLDVWRRYVVALCAQLSETAVGELKQDLLGRARSVASASGGLLGLGSKISKSERAVLTELEQAFPST